MPFLHSAGIIALATTLSRISGFIRDMVIAWYLGAGMTADAFLAAFRVPNLFRRLFAEGALSIAFVPVFSQRLAENGKEEAFRLARSAIRFCAVVLLPVCVLGALLSPLLVRLLAPGFAAEPAKFSLTVALTRVMLPYIFFIGLSAVFMGILNVLGHFAAPAVSPILFNLSILGGVFLVSPFLERPVFGLAVGVLAGGIFQLGFQAPFLVKRGFRFRRPAPLRHPDLKRIGRMASPSLLGASAYQINVLVGTLLASFLPEGSLSFLYYADRLVQFPLGIFGIAVATAVLPSVSREAALKDFPAVKETFALSMRLILFITLPAMAGLIVLREPIVTLLFQRGAFDAEAARKTAEALLFYAAGLWAFSAVRVTVSIFYALEDAKTPMYAAFLSMAANLFLGIVLMKPMGHSGIALATSLAAVVNLLFLFASLHFRLSDPGWRKMAKSACKSFGCSAIMGAVIWIVASRAMPNESGLSTALLLPTGAAVLTGILVYGALSFLMGSPELKTIFSIGPKGGS